MMGTLTTAAARPLSARLTRLRNRRLLSSPSSDVLSGMAQLLDPAKDAQEHQRDPERGEGQARRHAKGDQRDAGADGGGPDARRRQMYLVVLVHATNPSKYTRLKITTQTPSTKCQ